MIRFFRALLWMRWRLLANAVRHAGRRDLWGSLSQIVEALLPALLVVFIVPPALGMGVLAFLAGRGLGASGLSHPEILEAIRILLGIVTAAVVLMPVLRSAQGMSLDVSSLAHLPVPRRVLHLAELLSSFSDPWIAGFIPSALLLPAGLLAAGEAGAAAVTLAAGLLLLATFALLGAVCSFLFHLVLRDRRRGELAVLVLMAVLTVGGLLAGMIAQGLHGRRLEAAVEQVHGSVLLGGRGTAATPSPYFPAWSAPFPSEMYARALAASLRRGRGTPLPHLGGLLLLCAVLYAASLALHRTIVESPARSRGRRRGGAFVVRMWRLPGLTPGASAVAVAWVRLVLRTVRGKMVVYFTPLSFLMVVLLFAGSPGAIFPHGSTLARGVVLGFLGVGFTLLALQQVNLNQFALDRAGLTLQLLAPVSDRDLVLGKAAGGAVLAASSALLCIVPAALIAPGGSPWLWLAVVACGAWGYLMLAPLAAILSALFPKRADLSKLGRAGNPHAAAEILGFLFLAVLPIPPAATMGLALVLTESPALAFGIAAGWAVIAALLSLPLFRLAVRLVAARRESLAMVAERG